MTFHYNLLHRRLTAKRRVKIVPLPSNLMAQPQTQFFPRRVFESWQGSTAAVSTVVNNIWACYLSSELESTQLQPLAH